MPTFVKDAFKIMSMEKIQILVIGRDALVLQKLSSFINGNEQWECTATTDDESAVELFHQRKYDIVVLVDEMEGVSVNKFKSVFSFNNPDLILIHHVGDSTEILADEINEALKKGKKPVKIVDDVFKDKKNL
jgi:chemotaxis response regulator CheB